MKPVSSTINTPSSWPSWSATYCCRSSRTLSASQRLRESRYCSPSGGGVAGPLGELPPVLAADRSEQAAYVVPHPPAGLDPGEAAPGPQEEFFEFPIPHIHRRIVEHAEGLLVPAHGHAAEHSFVGRGGEVRPAHLAPRYNPRHQAADQLRYRTTAGVLGVELVVEADAAAFLAEVEQV